MSGPTAPSSDTNANPQVLTEKKKARNEVENLMHALNLNEGAVELPERKPAGTRGQKIVIDTNIFEVRTNGTEVFRYDVTVTGKSRRGKDVDLTKRSESTAVIADRIDICREAFRVVRQKHPTILGDDQHSVYYDLQSILFTLQPLHFEPGRDKIELVVANQEDTRLPGNLESVTMEIKQVREEAQRIKLDQLDTLIDPTTLKRDRSLLNFIELAVNQHAMFSERDFLTLRGSTAFCLDGAKHGLPEKSLDRGGSKYLASGVQKSATLIEGFKKEGDLTPQRRIGFLLEAKHSPFHSLICLTEAVRLNDGTNFMYDNFINGRCEDRDLTRLTRVFRKMQFTIKNTPDDTSNRRIELKSFDISTANSHMIQDLNKTVAQYFADKYGHALRLPNAHLVGVKRGNQWNYYPPEVCIIADNQVVTVEQMDAPSKAAMIKECAVRPDLMREENKNAAKAIQLRESKYTENAGIKFSKDTLATAARVLAPPSMEYSSGRATTRHGEAAWRSSQFKQPVNATGYGLFLLRTDYPHAMLSLNQMQAFINQIDNMSQRNMGMNLGTCRDHGIYTEFQVEECVKFCRDNKMNLCLFISPENIKLSHAVMKMCEHRYNVGTVQKMLQKGTATLENYIAKTNVKLGGLNYSVLPPDADVAADIKTTLYIGINTNQPGSKSVVDRVKSIKDDKPGVLGFAANMGRDFNSFFGDFLYTVAYRSEFYSQLKAIMKRCVATYTSQRGRPPPKVVFYYTGLTEGQFDNAYKLAVPLLKAGIRDGNNGADIPLTLLAVQKLNNVRLFPKQFPQGGNNPRDYEFNVRHGTTVDTVIVHPVFTEFYQMAHSALKGTGRVPRYTILLDENNYSMDTIQGVTHALAYEHQIVSRATSLPTPVYVAEGYAQRGRDVYNAACKSDLFHQFPTGPDGSIDFVALSTMLNYETTDLQYQRVNA
ncbi:Piwi domain protein [Aphelenchoides fujianensis]|nr:Piwi domain protein [Aphelenchoides fujianensis]